MQSDSLESKIVFMIINIYMHHINGLESCIELYVSNAIWYYPYLIKAFHFDHRNSRQFAITYIAYYKRIGV